MITNPVEESRIGKEGPPCLNYTLRTRVKSNIIFWSSIVLSTVIIPIVVYYPLVYLTNLSIGAILGFSTISSGLPTFLSFFQRIWVLWKKDGGDRRPLSGGVMDLFMWESICCSIIIVIFYIVSTTIPIPDLFLMAPSILVVIVGAQFFVSLLRPPSPIWLSSLPPGHKIRPAVYYIMEDIVAVDGGGGSAFRRDLNTRYESSPIFQRLLYEITTYWTTTGLVFIGVSAAFTFATSFNFAFAATLIWIPVWSCLCAIIAYVWIQRRLAQETDWFQSRPMPIVHLRITPLL